MNKFIFANTTTTAYPIVIHDDKIGIYNLNPEAPLHINDFMKIEPRSTAPSPATIGMIYYDSNDDNTDNNVVSKSIYYYKCGKCNKTANANTRPKSINDGLNEQFRKSIDALQFSKSFHNLFSKQLEILLKATVGILKSIATSALVIS